MTAAEGPRPGVQDVHQERLSQMDPKNPLRVDNPKDYLTPKKLTHAQRIGALLLPGPVSAIPDETALAAAFTARLAAVQALPTLPDSGFTRNGDKILFGDTVVASTGEAPDGSGKTVSMLRFDFADRHIHTQVVLTEDPSGESTPHIKATNYDTTVENILKIPGIRRLPASISHRIMEAPRAMPGFPSDSGYFGIAGGGRRERYEVGGNPNNVIRLSDRQQTQSPSTRTPDELAHAA